MKVKITKKIIERIKSEVACALILELSSGLKMSEIDKIVDLIVKDNVFTIEIKD